MGADSAYLSDCFERNAEIHSCNARNRSYFIGYSMRFFNIMVFIIIRLVRVVLFGIFVLIMFLSEGPLKNGFCRRATIHFIFISFSFI